MMKPFEDQQPRPTGAVVGRFRSRRVDGLDALEGERRVPGLASLPGQAGTGLTDTNEGARSRAALKNPGGDRVSPGTLPDERAGPTRGTRTHSRVGRGTPRVRLTPGKRPSADRNGLPSPSDRA